MVKNNNAFTLVELVVTIAVLGIVATIAIPSMSSLIQNQKLNSDIRSLSNLFSQTRNNASMFRKEASVNLENSGSNTDLNVYWMPESNQKLITTTKKVTFLSDGSIKDFSAEIDFTICNDKLKKSKTITLTRMGSQYFKAEGSCV